MHMYTFGLEVHFQFKISKQIILYFMLLHDTFPLPVLFPVMLSCAVISTQPIYPEERKLVLTLTLAYPIYSFR